jgi:HlyD family secretion protein
MGFMSSEKPDLSALRIDRKEEVRSKRPINSKLIKNFLYFLLVTVVVVAAYFIYQKVNDNSIIVEQYTVGLSFPSDSDALLTASGYIVAQRKASVASKGTGRLIYLGVVEGDAVVKDQVIARLEDEDIKAQLLQAKATLKLYEAELKEAEKYFNRQKSLFKTGSTTEELLESAEARYEKALANIDVAKAIIKASEVALENMLIRAPFNGTVLTKNADVGEIVTPISGSATSKSAVVTLADMKSLQVETDVSESNIQKIKLNQKCDIFLDAYPNLKYAGYVAKIVPTADRSKATVLVKVGFFTYDDKVLPEMSAKVNFLLEKKEETNNDNKPILMVPISSVRESGKMKIVYTIKEDMARQNIITTGRQFGDMIEVVSGLEEGDKIISKLNDNIKEKTKVKIK